MPKKICGLSFIELLVSMILMSLIILGLSSVSLFSRHHVINSDRRVKVQNELSYALEHMSKYVQQSNGNSSRNAIQSIATGFRVNIDLNSTQTPSVFTDDGWIDYTLSANTLTVTCTPNGGISPFIPATEHLSNMIIAGVAGFNVNITDQGTVVEIGLVGRYNPAVAAGPDNPQVSMKTRLTSPSSSLQ